jgi:hypothetical protein
MPAARFSVSKPDGQHEQRNTEPAPNAKQAVAEHVGCHTTSAIPATSARCSMDKRRNREADCR